MLTPDWTFFPQLLIFLATIVVLNLVLFRPVRKVLDERKEGTVDVGGEAEDLRAEAGRLEADYEGRIKTARDQAATERGKLRTEGQAEGLRLVEEARRQSEELTRKIAGELSSELEAARKALPSQAQAIAKQMVSTLLRRSA